MKVEWRHGSLKRECIRAKTPLSLEDARRLVAEYVSNYNQVRLHSSSKRLVNNSAKTKLTKSAGGAELIEPVK